MFMGKPIMLVSSEKHLGFPVGNVQPDKLMSDCIRDFNINVNMVKSHFKGLPPNIMYNLFKTYCMPLFGCVLWDLSSKYIEKFY